MNSAEVMKQMDEIFASFEPPSVVSGASPYVVSRGEVVGECYVRALMRIKSGDLPYTLKSVARWCKVDASNINNF